MNARTAETSSGGVRRAFRRALAVSGALGVVVVLTALVAPSWVTAVVAVVAFILVLLLLVNVRHAVEGAHRQVIDVVEPGAVTIRSAAETRQRMLDGMAASTRTIAESLDDMDRYSVDLREQAVVIGNRAHSASVSAEGAIEASASVEEAMTILKRGIETMHGLVARLSDHASEIEKVSITVDQIASRTNMLALNAAVEAARAGEEGKGFAVIAREIRGLARQSKSEATHITSLVTEIQRLTNTMVMSADERLQQFGRVGGSIDTVMNAFHSVESSIDEMAGAAEEMTASSRQQQASSEQVREHLVTLTDAAMQSKANLAPVYQALETLHSALDDLTAV